MEKARNYWEYEFIAETKLSEEERKLDNVEPATEQEIGWQKRFQFTRALNHARNGQATTTELVYLAKRGRYYPSTPKHLIIRPKA